MSTPPSEEGLSKTENDQMENYKWKVQKKGVESHKNKNRKVVGTEVNTEQSNHDSTNCFRDTFEDRLLDLVCLDWYNFSVWIIHLYLPDWIYYTSDWSQWRKIRS